jgi:hypothetical protein
MGEGVYLCGCASQCYLPKHESYMGACLVDWHPGQHAGSDAGVGVSHAACWCSLKCRTLKEAGSMCNFKASSHSITGRGSLEVELILHAHCSFK